MRHPKSHKSLVFCSAIPEPPFHCLHLQPFCPVSRFPCSSHIALWSWFSVAKAPDRVSDSHMLLLVMISPGAHSLPFYFKTYYFVLFLFPYLFVLPTRLCDPQGQRICFIHLCFSYSVYHDVQPE